MDEDNQKDTLLNKGQMGCWVLLKSCVELTRPYSQKCRHRCSVLLGFVASDAVIAMRDVQRTTLASNGNAKPSMTMCDAFLSYHHHPNVHKVKQPTEMQ